jgi:hypothetical protein
MRSMSKKEVQKIGKPVPTSDKTHVVPIKEK